MSRPCTTCGKILEADARFCDNCGTTLAPVGAQAGGQARGTMGRRLVALAGTSPDCELVVQHEKVSSHHVAFWQDQGALWVVDLGSTNGTFVGGDRVTQPRPLPTGAGISLGPMAVEQSTLFQVLSSGRGSAGLLVGRGPEADIKIDAPVVSTLHILALPTGAGVRVADLHSSNGTCFGTRDQRLPGLMHIGRDGVLFLGSYRLPVALLLGPRANRMAVPTDTGSMPAALDAPSQASIGTDAVILGRVKGTGVVAIPFPQVSARHARVTPLGNGTFEVKDLGSTNGTFINGQRISTAPWKPGDRLSLGSCPVELDATGAVYAEDVQGTIRLDGIAVDRIVKHRETKLPFKLLDNVSTSIYPAELVGLMGPSGAGKTTIMLALNGYEPPTNGQVLINGEDLYTNFDRFRGLIGYVPQDDIIHGALTVGESLYYTAKLRLPPDTMDEEIEQRVDRVLTELKLTEQKTSLIGTVEQKVLSGGQRKRVNLAQELVTDPTLLFLDEPTSGLSSQDTTDVLEVLRGLSNSGRTIIMTIHQPSAEVYGMLDHVLYLSKGGLMAFFGPTDPDSYQFFEVGQGKPDAVMKSLQDGKKPEEWNRKYLASHQYQEFVKRRLAERPQAPQHQARPKGGSASWLGQFWTLLRRYKTIKLRDKGNLVTMALQAPIVGILIALMFRDGKDDPMQRAVPLFLMCISCIFFGCFNAAREIVNELAIYHRERMVNLKLVPYLASKFVFLTVVGIIQVLIIFVLVRFGVGLQGNVLLYLAVLTGTVMASTAMGLVLSSVVRSAEAAMAIVPIILIPQIMLAGVLKPLDTDPLKVLATPMIARWSNEALVDIEHDALEDTKKKMTKKVPDCKPIIHAPTTPPRPPRRRGGRPMMRCPQPDIDDIDIKCDGEKKEELKAAPVWKKGIIEKNELTAHKQQRDLAYLLLFALGLGVACAAFMLLKDRKT